MTTVIMQTTFGDITIELNEEKAPISCKNFLHYIENDHYKDCLFHRVIPNFMIQGGGYTEDLKEKPTADAIKNEANNGLKNEIGSIAMARTPNPDSATSQFFINVSDNVFLNFTSETESGWGYAVFAKVTDGMDVVKKIESVETGNKNGHSNVPTESVFIYGCTVNK